MWAPGRTAAVGTTGSVEVVHPHTTSQAAASPGPPTSRRRPPARATTAGSATKAADESGVRPQATIRSMSGRTTSIASRWPRAWTPVPKIPRLLESGWARTSAATAEAAGVRRVVRAEPSSVAVGTPVSRSQYR